MPLLLDDTTYFANYDDTTKSMKLNLAELPPFTRSTLVIHNKSGAIEIVGHTHASTALEVGDILAATAGVKQTLYPLSGRMEIYDITNGTLTWLITQTEAQAHDASDLTFDRPAITGDHINTPTSGYVGVTYALDTCTYGGVIDKITIRVRAIQDDCTAAEISTWFVATTRAAPTTFTDSVAWYSWDFTTNPITSTPWTSESINAITDWGWWAQLVGADEFADPFCTVYEFEVQVHGTSLDRLAVGDANKVLAVVGGAPAWSALPAHDILSTSHGDTTAASCTAGHIIYGVGSPAKWESSTPAAAGLAVDATRTWTTKQTFPLDGTNCPVFKGDSSNGLPAFEMIDIVNDEPELLTVQSNGDGVCILKPGLMVALTDVTPVLYGGTGATTLAGAGITTFVGTPWNGIGLTGNTAAQTMLAASHPAGFYRISAYCQCTTAGAAGSLYVLYHKYNDGVSTKTAVTTVFNIYDGGAETGPRLTNTLLNYEARPTFYSDGSVAIQIYNGAGTYNTNPVFNIRARLEYLGA